jgi:hypothetical protein
LGEHTLPSGEGKQSGCSVEVRQPAPTYEASTQPLQCRQRHAPLQCADAHQSSCIGMTAMCGFGEEAIGKGFRSNLQCQESAVVEVFRRCEPVPLHRGQQESA